MYVHTLSLTGVNRHLSSRETLGKRRDTRRRTSRCKQTTSKSGWSTMYRTPAGSFAKAGALSRQQRQSTGRTIISQLSHWHQRTWPVLSASLGSSPCSENCEVSAAWKLLPLAVAGVVACEARSPSRVGITGTGSNRYGCNSQSLKCGPKGSASSQSDMLTPFSDRNSKTNLNFQLCKKTS